MVEAMGDHRGGHGFIIAREALRRRDLTTKVGEMWIFTVMASLAQFERTLISERVKAGMARAKAQGKRISRTPLAEALQAQIVALAAEGLSIHQIGKQLGIGYGTAWKYIQHAKEG
jgi:DNA invertase Pin-like site-specific DNA recombinase